MNFVFKSKMILRKGNKKKHNHRQFMNFVFKSKMILRKGNFIFNNLINLNMGQYAGAYASLGVMHTSPKPQSETCDNWKPIYKFPLIHWTAAFNKLKFYQFGVTAIGVPLTFALETSISQIPEGAAVIFSILGITGGITLTMFSLFTKNIIGIIYVNNLRDKVKLSYVDFWGYRKDIEIIPAEIMPPSGLTRTLDLYQNVGVVTSQGGKQNYKLMRRFAIVLNSEEYSSIFGE